MKDLYKNLVSKLESLFGSFDEEHKKFTKAPNSEIARELGYSDAQFSRLINQNATEGEYQRANKTVERILSLIELEERLKKVGVNPKQALASPKKRVIFLIVGLIIGSLLSYSCYVIFYQTNPMPMEKYDMLKWSFETSDIKPYVKLKDLPDDCNYPCYKYQGKWQLDKTYKLPVFTERNGFHYLAKEVILYNRCMDVQTKKGNMIEGFEYQYHEIWYDKRELPIDSFLLDSKNTELSADYINSNFEKDKSFVKMAILHTFFRNEFQLDSNKVLRSGKVIGREIEFVDKEQLLDKLSSEEQVEEIVKELNAIIIKRMEDFSKPISCSIANLPQVDFHNLTQGDLMSFDCQLTTDRLSLDYTKTYRFTDQYIKSTCQPTQ